MNKEIQSILCQIKNLNSGEPLFGRAVFEVPEEGLSEFKPSPKNNTLKVVLPVIK